MHTADDNNSPAQRHYCHGCENDCLLQPSSGPVEFSQSSSCSLNFYKRKTNIQLLYMHSRLYVKSRICLTTVHVVSTLAATCIFWSQVAQAHVMITGLWPLLMSCIALQGFITHPRGFHASVLSCYWSWISSLHCQSSCGSMRLLW